jgi:hypothetical protein
MSGSEEAASQLFDLIIKNSKLSPIISTVQVYTLHCEKI